MSPVSETTVVMSRNGSSLLVMGEPPSATSFRRLSRLGSSYASAKPKRPRNLTGPSPFSASGTPKERPMPNQKNLKDLFTQTPKDIYFAKKQNLRAATKMAKEASSPELKEAFETHR